jgi:hypothetical protein
LVSVVFVVSLKNHPIHARHAHLRPTLAWTVCCLFRQLNNSLPAETKVLFTHTSIHLVVVTLLLFWDTQNCEYSVSLIVFVLGGEIQYQK